MVSHAEPTPSDCSNLCRPNLSRPGLSPRTHGRPPAATIRRARRGPAENRAVHLARKHLHGQGWIETADQPKNGVGHDLGFERDGEEQPIEVKASRAAGCSSTSQRRSGSAFYMTTDS